MQKRSRSKERLARPAAAQEGGQASSASREAGQVVRITGWRPGLQKISLTHLLAEAGNLRLPEAKRLVDRLLASESVEVTVPRPRAGDLVAELVELGAEASLRPPPRMATRLESGVK